MSTRYQMKKPFRLMKRKMLSDNALMQQWRTEKSFWTRDEADIVKAGLEMKGWECRIVEDH